MHSLEALTQFKAVMMEAWVLVVLSEWALRGL